jgi:hypothetical protein
MWKLEAFKVGKVQKEGKKENMVCELESLFSSWYFFFTPFHLHFKDFFLKPFPNHFKSLKMKHKWWRSKEVIDVRVIIGDEQLYPTKVKPNINSIE